jgi:hypothetical protein
MITYRTEKGAPLTADEIDGNFRELVARIKVLEAHLESGEGLGQILVQGDQMTLIGTFGKEFGTFTLPKAVLTPRGPWLPQTPYQKLDLVTYENGLYCCAKDHPSTTWEHDAPLWQCIIPFPKAPPSPPLYEKATLPAHDALGTLALFMEEGGPTLILFDGEGWQRLIKGEKI